MRLLSSAHVTSCSQTPAAAGTMVCALLKILRNAAPNDREETMLDRALQVLDERHAGIPVLRDLVQALEDGPDAVREVALDRAEARAAYRVPEASESNPTVAAGSRAELPSLSATQRAVLVALCRPYEDTELATPRPTSGSPTSCISPSTRSRQLRTLFGYFGVEHLAQNQKRSYLVMRAL